MIALYTYFPLKDQEACGFFNTNDLASFLALSIEYSKKHFKKVKLVTNKAGKKILIDKYKIGFTEVSTELEGLQFPKELWAYPKIVSLCLEKEPCVHLDLDVILWEPLSKEIIYGNLFFQHKELFTIEKGYVPLIKAIEKTTISFFLKNLKVDYAYNCGIIGVNDKFVIPKLKELVDEFIFNPANDDFWTEQSNKEQFNYIFEQYFIACIIKDLGIEKSVGFILDSKENISKPKFKMTHLWGETKQSPDIKKIKLRLQKEFPKAFKHICSFDNNETHVFDKLFYKLNDKQKDYLNKIIKEKKIKSIVYLKYDENHSKYVNLDGKNIDFLYSEGNKDIIPTCDLLITDNLLKQIF